MTLFPMFMKLEGRSCLVVGAGTIGEPKIEQPVDRGRFGSRDRASRHCGGCRVGAGRKRSSGKRESSTLPISTAFSWSSPPRSSREVNAAIFHEAQQRNILCNVVDDPEYCDFYYPAVVRRGDLQLAISTNGHSPALAQRIRRELEIQFGPEYGEWLEELGKIRQQLFASKIEPGRTAAPVA